MIQSHEIVLDVRDPRVLNTDIVMVQNDNKSNMLHITMQGVDDWAGVTGQAKYMRSDGMAVVDSIVFVDGVADHTVPLAALNIAGPVKCEVALLKNDVRATTNQIVFAVRADIDADVRADEKFPILDGLIQSTQALNNSAKVDAEKAETAATNASASATNAVTSASNAATSASTAVARASEASSGAQVATTKAAEAEASATNAKTEADRAKTEAGSAEYWAGQAKAIAGGGVVTFNRRSGAVLPQAGDYTAEMVGAPTVAQLEALDAKVSTTTGDVTTQNLNIIDLAINLETLKASVLTGVNANIFVETFQSLNDISMTHGIYDSVNKKIYL